MKKRLLAMLMALVLVLSCLPTWSVALHIFRPWVKFSFILYVEKGSSR